MNGIRGLTEVDNDPLGQEIRIIQEKLSIVEKYFQLLGSTFAGSAKMSARMRDTSDNVAKTIHAYSEAEFDNTTLKNSLTGLAKIFVQIGTYRDEEAHLIESSIVKQLASYEEICRAIREELKQLISQKDKLEMKRKHLERLKVRSSRNRQEISAMGVELVKATGQVQRSVATTEDLVESFEKQKLTDLRLIFRILFKIQLRYHTKALELLTQGYQIASSIDEDLDIQEFSSALRSDHNIEARHSTVKRFPMPKTTSITTSIANLFSSSSSEAPKISPARFTNKSEEELNSKSTTPEPEEEKCTGVELVKPSSAKNSSDIDESPREEVSSSLPVPAPRKSLAKSGTPSPIRLICVSPAPFSSSLISSENTQDVLT